MTDEFKTIPYRRPSDSDSGWSRADTVNLLVVLCLALFLRAWNIDQPSLQYFDEVYYVDAATELLAGKPDPNSVHPPLGKWIIGAGIEMSKKIGGPDVDPTISWRCAAVLAGVLMVGATYGFGLVLFQYNRVAATAAAVFVATEHLHLTMTRIAMLDPFLALFCLLGTWWSFVYFLGGHERWAVLGAFSFGLATACKWSGLFSAFGCFVVCVYLARYSEHVYGKAQRYFCWLLLLMPLAFFLSYAHLFLQNGFELDTLKTIFNQGERMVKFRANADKFVHGYKSYFRDWPLIRRPIWLHYESDKGLVTGICSTGVWATWWFFTVLLLERLYTGLVKRRDLIAGSLVILWFCQWLPWAVSFTGGFFYYMLPQIPIMGLLLGKLFADLANFDDILGEGRWRAWLLAGLYLLGFVLYYPFAIALEVPKWLFKALFFLPGWI